MRLEVKEIKEVGDHIAIALPEKRCEGDGDCGQGIKNRERRSTRRGWGDLFVKKNLTFSLKLNF